MSIKENTWVHEFFTSMGSAIGYEMSAHLHHEQSEYQTIDVYQSTHFGKVMALDGCWMVSEKDNFLYHEMMVHPVLQAHPKPETVVVIGGGDCGTLKEVLKHQRVKKAIQIELDERVTRISEQFFPELCEANHDPRAQLLFEDGIAWMKNVAAGSIDVIIIDSTDPVGPAEGLFNVPFFKTCFKALTQQGIFVQQSESPLLHQDILQSLRQRLPQAGFEQVRHLSFPMPSYPSGWWSATAACKDQKLDLSQPGPEAQRELDTLYYHEQMHQAAFVMPRFLSV